MNFVNKIMKCGQDIATSNLKKLLSESCGGVSTFDYVNEALQKGFLDKGKRTSDKSENMKYIVQNVKPRKKNFLNMQ